LKNTKTIATLWCCPSIQHFCINKIGLACRPSTRKGSCNSTQSLVVITTFTILTARSTTICIRNPCWTTTYPN